MKYLKLYENFSNDDVQKLKDFVAKNSYFNFDGGEDDDDQLLFATRENGNVGSEEPGRKDIDEAKKLAKLIKDQFGLNSEIEFVDEWVHLNVMIKDAAEPEVRYSIVKHAGSIGSDGSFDQGFSKRHPLEDLEKSIISWTDVTKKEAQDLIKKAQDAPFKGNDFSDYVAIVPINSKSMGYNWSLVKRQSRWDSKGRMRKIDTK